MRCLFRNFPQVPSSCAKRPFSSSLLVAEQVTRLGLNLDEIVVTGVGAGLPNTTEGKNIHWRAGDNNGGIGKEYQRVFRPNNVDLLIEGNNFITPLSEHEKYTIIDKNISLVGCS